MNPIRLAVPLVAGALLVAGCGSSDSVTAQNASAQAPAPGGGFGGGPDTAALAKALGVSQTKLQAAMQAVMPNRGNGGPSGAGGPPAGGTRPTGTPPAGGAPNGGPSGAGGPPGGGGFGNGQFAKQLAKQLGVSESKVQKAFQSVAPQGAQTGSTS